VVARFYELQLGEAFNKPDHGIFWRKIARGGFSERDQELRALHAIENFGNQNCAKVLALKAFARRWVLTVPSVQFTERERHFGRRRGCKAKTNPKNGDKDPQR